MKFNFVESFGAARLSVWTPTESASSFNTPEVNAVESAGALPRLSAAAASGSDGFVNASVSAATGASAASVSFCAATSSACSGGSDSLVASACLALSEGPAGFAVALSLTLPFPWFFCCGFGLFGSSSAAFAAASAASFAAF